MKKLLLMFFLLFACGSAAAQDFFPVFGMTLGETTRQQASQLGYRSTNSKYPECFSVGTWSFWDHDKDGVFEQLYITYTDSMPAQWTSIGCSWALSYDGWLSLVPPSGLHCRGKGVSVCGDIQRPQLPQGGILCNQPVERTAVPSRFQLRQ